MTKNEAILRDIIIDGNGYDYDESIPQKIFEEIQQYRAIGTIKEFKALKEKSVVKKVIAKKDGDHTFYFCPKCKIVVGNSFTGHIAEYCKCCGQKLDWQ